MKRLKDLLRNSLLLEKLAIFEQICRKILRAYEYIRSKNFAAKMPKRAILTTKWNYARGLKKKPFLLFELLLSFTLLVLIFFPMLKTHFAIANEEIKTIEKMEFEKMGRNIFSLIEEQLYENRFHTFDDLKKGIKGEIKNPLQSHIGKKYRAEYQVIPIECVTKRSNGERYLVFDVELSIIAKEKVLGTYTSTFLVEEHEKT